MINFRTISLLIIAGLAEISGAYFIWQWIRNSKSAWLGLIGVAALFAYAVTQTMQDFNFGRVFAAYGGIFIALGLGIGWSST
jgi:small multidrug resistance family-3 protein